MKIEEVFEVWAPRGGWWSDWVKPVVFAHLSGETQGLPSLGFLGEIEVGEADGSGVVVLDLEGGLGIEIGMDLARRGWRPVVLYNAVPGPGLGMSVCDLEPMMHEIRKATEELAGLKLRGDAPAVFILDAERAVGQKAARAGMFDNRSVSLATDFPSGRLLRERGVKRVTLVQVGKKYVQPDLAHTLVRWQEAGIEVWVMELGEGLAERIVVRKPAMFRRVWQRFLATVGLKRNRLGGFGGYLPVPGGSGVG